MTHSLKRVSSFRITSRPFPDPSLLFHYPIPPSLWGLNPRSIMGKSQWSRVRESIIRFNTRKIEGLSEKKLLCHACGSPLSDCLYQKPIECHEVYSYNTQTLRASLEGVVGVCYTCHNYLHKGRLKKLVKQKHLSRKRHNQILDHGGKVISKIPIERRGLFLREEQAFLKFVDKNWTLGFMGVEYKGRVIRKKRRRAPNTPAKKRKPPNARQRVRGRLAKLKKRNRR